MWAGSDPRPIRSCHAVAPLPPSISRDDVMDGRPISSQIVMPYRILGNTGLQSYKCGQTNHTSQNEIVPETESMTIDISEEVADEINEFVENEDGKESEEIETN